MIDWKILANLEFGNIRDTVSDGLGKVLNGFVKMLDGLGKVSDGLILSDIVYCLPIYTGEWFE